MLVLTHIFDLDLTIFFWFALWHVLTLADFCCHRYMAWYVPYALTLCEAAEVNYFIQNLIARRCSHDNGAVELQDLPIPPTETRVLLDGCEFPNSVLKAVPLKLIPNDGEWSTPVAYFSLSDGDVISDSDVGDSALHDYQDKLPAVPLFPYPSGSESIANDEISTPCLATLVKDFQSSSRRNCRRWHRYVRSHGRSSFDPNRHQQWFLSAFLDTYSQIDVDYICHPLSTSSGSSESASGELQDNDDPNSSLDIDAGLLDALSDDVKADTRLTLPFQPSLGTPPATQLPASTLLPPPTTTSTIIQEPLSIAPQCIKVETHQDDLPALEINVLRDRACASLGESALIIRAVLGLRPRKVQVILLNSLLDEINLLQKLAESVQVSTIQELCAICSDLIREVVQDLQLRVNSSFSSQTFVQGPQPNVNLRRLSGAHFSPGASLNQKCLRSADVYAAAAVFDDSVKKITS